MFSYCLFTESFRSLIPISLIILDIFICSSAFAHSFVNLEMAKDFQISGLELYFSCNLVQKFYSSRPSSGVTKKGNC